jgi:hypothetical protein
MDLIKIDALLRDANFKTELDFLVLLVIIATKTKYIVRLFPV